MSSIPGLEHLEKEGWELVRVGKLMPGDYWLNGDGLVVRWDFPHQSAALNYIIVRKIARPKTYRAFANAAEFKPYRDRWIKQTLGDSVSFTRIDGYGKEGVTIQGNAYRYQELLDNRTFDDGSPFGVEVQS